MLFETGKKFIKSFSEVKNTNLWCLLYRNVADDVLFQKHFTDLDYLDWFSTYEGFGEPRYLQTRVQIHMPRLLQIYFNSESLCHLLRY